MRGTKYARYSREDAVLRRHAVALTAHLEQALSLVGLSDEYERRSYFSRPSIAPHEQNPDWESDGWSHLIDLVRDSHLALARVDRGGADHLLGRWASSNHLLFRRLALHALTEVPKSDIRLARKLLVAGRRPGCGSWSCTARYSASCGWPDRAYRATCASKWCVPFTPSPRRGMRELDERLTRREKALRLFKLAESGALVDKKSRALAAEVAAEIEAIRTTGRSSSSGMAKASRIVRRGAAAARPACKGHIATSSPPSGPGRTLRYTPSSLSNPSRLSRQCVVSANADNSRCRCGRTSWRALPDSGRP